MTKNEAAERLPRTKAGRSLDHDIHEWSGLERAWTRAIMEVEAEERRHVIAQIRERLPREKGLAWIDRLLDDVLAGSASSGGASNPRKVGPTILDAVEADRPEMSDAASEALYETWAQDNDR